METKNVLFLFAGVVLGALGAWLYCEYSRDEGNEFAEGQIQLRYIDQKEADNQRNNYTETFRNDLIKGYNISYQQLVAIDSTLKKMQPAEIKSTSGFRLYKGLDTKNNTLSAKSFIIYPIDTSMKMRIPSQVYKVTGFDDKFILPCPDFCD